MALSKKPVNGMKDILPEEMQTGEPVHIRAAGNTRLWRKNARENTCRFMRMSAVLTFSIPRIFA